MYRSILYALTLLVLLPASVSYAATDAAPVTIGQSTVALTGPWRFHTGDDPRWIEPEFDDSGWQSMDLTPPPGATDGDVGLDGFAPGWNAKGHPGYHGYAWYRIRLNVTPPAGRTLALLGPWAVDSAYQIYANGHLLGGVGDFSGATPTAHGYHYPRYFALPGGIAHGGPTVFAVRVWAGPWVNGPQSGGMHIAPVIGEQAGILAQYRLQWLKIFEGYVVDAVPALLFVLMAVTVLCLLPFERSGSAYLWLAAALLLSAIQRGNQAFFFWLEIETVRDFVILIVAVVGTLSLAAWTMAWRAWFKIDRPKWLPKAVAALSVLLIVVQLLSHPWLFGDAVPHTVALVSHDMINYVRLAFLSMLAWIVFQGIRSQGREAWIALPAVLAMGAFLFAGELAAVNISGIWFPWGVGLSLSECASVVFDILLACLLLRRLWFYARQRNNATAA